MNDQYEMFDLRTFPDTRNAISLRASASGHTLSAKPSGETKDQSGPGAAPANRSATLAPDAVSMMNGISGQNGGGSSASAALSLSLASKLVARMDTTGSTLYRMTWKAGSTPQGRRFCVRRASVPRISGTAYTGWPTPTAGYKQGGATTDPEKVLARALGAHSNDLQDFVHLVAGWPTPKAEDAESTGFSAKRLAAGKIPDNLHSATKLLVTGWATPAARDYRTPNHKPLSERGGQTKGEQLNNQVAHMIPGASLNGLPAETGKLGLLNPDFSRWLQGIPETWGSCGPTGTRLTP